MNYRKIEPNNESAWYQLITENNQQTVFTQKQCNALMLETQSRILCTVNFESPVVSSRRQEVIN